MTEHQRHRSEPSLLPLVLVLAVAGALVWWWSAAAWWAW